MTQRTIRVLIVDDSAVVRGLLAHILGDDAEIEVIGTASDGEEAVQAVERLQPDVITMDIQMPKMNGIEATRRIMQTRPVPIVIVSANWNPDEVAITFEAIEAGAVALAEKPRGLGHPNYAEMSKKLVQTVKSMSEVRVVRRWAKTTKTETTPAATSSSPHPAARLPDVQHNSTPIGNGGRPSIRLIAIGVSTGGPPVLQKILEVLPPTLAVPVVIVQHIAAGFLPGLVDWLDKTTGFPTSIAIAGERLRPGHAYLAPDNHHFGVDRLDHVVLSSTPPENNLRPAVSYLFRTVAHSYGAAAAGVLLTGMGKDGATELKLMRENGAITIAQDKESSIVHGMPGEAIALGAAMHVLPPDKIALLLVDLVSGKR